MADETLTMSELAQKYETDVRIIEELVEANALPYTEDDDDNIVFHESELIEWLKEFVQIANRVLGLDK